jgi:hypothetical protein
VGEAAMAEAAGASSDDPENAAERMEQARDKWLELGRPLDAARCLTVRGRLLAKPDPATASALLDEAADEYERLGAPALAANARESARA